jgi:hypothetical protein
MKQIDRVVWIWRTSTVHNGPDWASRSWDEMVYYPLYRYPVKISCSNSPKLRISMEKTVSFAFNRLKIQNYRSTWSKRFEEIETRSLHRSVLVPSNKRTMRCKSVCKWGWLAIAVASLRSSCSHCRRSQEIVFSGWLAQVWRIRSVWQMPSPCYWMLWILRQTTKKQMEFIHNMDTWV